jgi:hypothetical protein
MPLQTGQWADAINQLQSENFFGGVVLFHNGNSAANYNELIIRNDATGDNLKPLEATLETAYANFLAAQTVINNIESAQNAALNQARDYLRKQLLSPATIPTIYTTVKAYVDGNTHLSAMMNTRMTLANLAYGWTVASMTNPANNNDRSRYLECVFGILAVLA